MAEDHLFCHTAAHGNRQISLHLVARHGNRIAFGQAHDHAKGAAARNDGGFVDRVRVRHFQRNQRVAGFMIRRELLLFVAHHHGAALGAHHDLVFGVFKLFLGDQPLGTAGGQQSCLVHQVGQIST